MSTDYEIVDIHSMTDSEFCEWAEVFLAVARDAMAAFVEEK